jgi:signal transduction histidine kinase
MSLNYRAYPILYVDDERSNLVALRYALDDEFTLHVTSSPEEALTLLAERDIAVVLADQRMPEMDGVELCERAAELRPDAVRIIITAYADLHAAIEAINRGRITRYIAKPFRNDELAQVLKTAIELVHIQRTVRQMEVRLLSSGQSMAANTINDELAHEIKNVLQPVSSSVETSRELVQAATRQAAADPNRTLELLEEASAFHAQALEGIEQLAGIVHRLQHRHRRQTSVKHTCDAARVVDSTLRLLRQEIESVARLEATIESAPLVRVDATALGQVIINLLLNACQAFGAGSSEARITVRVGVQGNEALVRVSDNGPGIAEEALQRIFDPFFTTKENGSGLGLPIARRLVVEAGGDLDVETSGREGTTMRLRLPLA